MSIYSPPAPTIEGQQLTVSHLVNSPVLVQRTMLSLVQLRLIAGHLLTGRVDMTGSGSATFEVDENIYADDEPELIDDLTEYPNTSSSDPELAVVTAGKYGLATNIPDAVIARNRMDVVMRKMTQIANRIAVGFDGRALSAIGSAVSQTHAAAAAWNTPGADPFLDVMLAGAKLDEQDRGYLANTVVARPTLWARLMANAKVLDTLPRESSPVALTGNLLQIGGYTLLKSTRLPVGVDAMVVDATQLGAVAFEFQGGGYSGNPAEPLGVETKVVRLDTQDGVRIQVRKVAEPVVLEPSAAVKLTGV